MSALTGSSVDSIENDGKDVIISENAPLALHNNREYLRIVSQLRILYALRIQVERDIDALNSVQQEAFEDPEAFIEKLNNGTLNLPDPLDISKVILIYFQIFLI